jgi:hypothetical protein
VGEAPVVDFTYENLSRELRETQEYNSEVASQKLVELSEYSDTKRVAARIVDQLESLPWKYTVTIQFHKELSQTLLPLVQERAVGDTIRVAQVNSEFEDKFPLTSGIKARDQSIQRRGLLSIVTDNKWDADLLCLQFKIDGFIGYYGESAGFEAVKEELKSFCGLGIALRLFRLNPQYRSTPSVASFYIHRFEQDRWVVQGSKQFDHANSDTFHDLSLNDLDGTLNTDTERARWLDARLSEIGTVFSNRKRTEKLLLACQWLFESYSGKNELLAFVQTTVVIEILLGDRVSSEQMGLGVLLRNRCAYLIGSTQRQRNEILEEFQKIYDVRSKIVHSGKKRINFTERALYRKLQWMCRRVIQEEVRLLMEDLKSEAKN